MSDQNFCQYQLLYYPN